MNTQDLLEHITASREPAGDPDADRVLGDLWTVPSSTVGTDGERADGESAEGPTCP
jgi:hypothetical protein